ncbi:MAG: hypothetical protein JST81_02175 [Bacteroidetes bacterium]|nr:hypothetical protein [Bacteroidota bacterium]
MKNSLLRTLMIGCFVMLSIQACKKSKDDNTNNTDNSNVFPTVISNIAPQSMIDSLRNLGANVYAGSTPPAVEGIYFMTPDSCVYDNSPAASAGSIYSDYKFRFSNQDNSNFTVNVEQKAIPANVLSATPAKTYISGNGNNFTIFVLRTLTPSGITVEQFNVLSGTVTSGGIQNFQNTLYMRSKGDDPNNLVVAAGTVRRFVTGGSGLAASVSDF